MSKKARSTSGWTAVTPRFGVFCVVMVALLWVFHIVQGNEADTDFRAFHTAYRIVASGDHDSLYDFEKQRSVQSNLVREKLAARGADGAVALLDDDRLLPFVNPPHVALVGFALGRLSLRTAYLVFGIANVAALCAFLWSLVRLAADRDRSDVRRLLIFSAGFAPVGIAMLQGAWSVVLAIGLSLFTLAWRKDRVSLMALAVPLLMTKPQYAILPGLALLCDRKWRHVAIGACSALATIAVSSAALGSSVWMDYLRATNDYARQSDRFGVHANAMVNVRGLLIRLTDSPALGDTGARVAILLAVVATVVLWIAKRTSRNPVGSAQTLLLAGTLTLGAVTSVHAHTHDLVALLVVVALLFSEGYVSSDKAKALFTAAPLAILILTLDSSALGGTITVLGLLSAAMALLVAARKARLLESERDVGFTPTHAQVAGSSVETVSEIRTDQPLERVPARLG